MVQTILFVLYETSDKNILQPDTNIFKSFYRVRLINNPTMEEISLGKFEKALLNPSLDQLIKSLHPNTLVCVCFLQKQIGYIGVVRDVLSRNYSIELPAELSWDEFLECVHGTDKSPIRFH